MDSVAFPSDDSVMLVDQKVSDLEVGDVEKSESDGGKERKTDWGGGQVEDSRLVALWGRHALQYLLDFGWSVDRGIQQ